MLSPDDHPGIFTFLVGLVVLVMVSIGLSLMMEKRFAFSSDSVRLERELRASAQESQSLKEDLERAKTKLQQLVVPRARDAMALRDTKRLLAGCQQRMNALVTTRDAMAVAILTVEEAFTNYRADYRTRIRAAAEGEEIGSLTLRDGRKYQQTSITKVTDVGLEIRHEQGFARIHAPDLGPEWQDKFQWDDEERREKLAQEAEILRNMPLVATKEANPVREVKKPMPTIAAPQSLPTKDEAEKIAALRLQFSGWKSKVNRLISDRNEAVSKSSYETSVPGRLETWNARATRLGAELTKARIELGNARARLAASSPYDPLLQLRPGEVE